MKKSFLVEGPIAPQKVADLIEKHQHKTGIGAHCQFLGQVRADKDEKGLEVVGIEYSAYPEMANKVIYDIKEEAFVKFDLKCLHIYHSTGLVKAGEISLYVMVSSPHRKASFDGLYYIVEELKKRSPIWKKEIMSDQSHRWVGVEPPKQTSK